MLNLTNLEKRYGEKELFSNVSIQFPDQGVIGLVGPNGAGKSTLMRIIMGEESQDAGEVIPKRGATIACLGQDAEANLDGSVLDTALEGFADILDMERRLEELSEQAADTDNLEAVLEEMGRVQAAFEQVDGYSLVERAKAMLQGLGYSNAEIEGPMRNLSGGWRMRVILAQLLLQGPDVLLLDEPTNHLDIDAILWLEQFLKEYSGLIILTSHDRSFLDKMCDYILAFEFNSLRLEKGNYSHYETTLEARTEQAEREAEIAQREKERLEKFVVRFKAKATKARQAQSRAKQIERMEIPEVKNPRPPKIHIHLPEVPRAPRTIATFKNVVKGFDEKLIFDHIDWTLERNQKIAVVGPNGAGKTTMLRLLTNELPCDSGQIDLGDAVEMGYFAQHHLELLDSADSVLDFMQNEFPDASIGEVRANLGGFLFSGDEVKKKVRVLSGGERARLSLARLFFRPKNLIVLDEPTNHLDMTSIEVLARTLKKFPGTVVAVSHDRSFLNRFVSHVVDLRPGKFISYAGNMNAYEYHWKQRQAALSTADVEPKTEPAPKEKDKDRKGGGNKTSGGDDFKAKKKLRSDFKSCARELSETEAEIERLQGLLADPASASDHEVLWQTQKELDELRAREVKLMSTWEDFVNQGQELGLDLLEEF